MRRAYHNICGIINVKLGWAVWPATAAKLIGSDKCDSVKLTNLAAMTVHKNAGHFLTQQKGPVGSIGRGLSLTKITGSSGGSEARKCWLSVSSSPDSTAFSWCFLVLGSSDQLTIKDNCWSKGSWHSEDSQVKQWFPILVLEHFWCLSIYHLYLRFRSSLRCASPCLKSRREETVAVRGEVKTRQRVLTFHSESDTYKVKGRYCLVHTYVLCC